MLPKAVFVSELILLPWTHVDFHDITLCFHVRSWNRQFVEKLMIAAFLVGNSDKNKTSEHLLGKITLGILKPNSKHETPTGAIKTGQSMENYCDEFKILPTDHLESEQTTCNSTSDDCMHGYI